MHGKVSNDDYSGGLRVSAESVFDLQLAREARARSLRITLNGNADAARLRQMLNPFRAEPENGVPGVPVEVRLSRDEFQCVVRLGEDWRVRMADAMLDQLGDWRSEEHTSELQSLMRISYAVFCLKKKKQKKYK